MTTQNGPLLEPEPDVRCGPWRLVGNKYHCRHCGLRSHFADKKSPVCKRDGLPPAMAAVLAGGGYVER